MRASTGSALMVAGTAVGVAAGVGLLVGVHPTLPPALLSLVIYKAIFAGAAGLLATGAIIRRRALLGRGDRQRELPPESGNRP